MEPPLPLLPGPGRARRRRPRRPGARRRLRGPAVARGLQRRLPPGRPGAHGDRRDALADRARGPAAARPRRSTASRSWRSASTRSSAPDTEALLRAMGFVHAGPHRSKPVQLWEHGEIRVVLNHGVGDEDPEVVAIAVSSRDPAASATRAEALLAPRVERRRGAGEADLTAVAAPDGTAVFFCGTDWLGDFLPTGESGGERRADRAHRPHHARAAVRGLRRGGPVLPLGARPAAEREPGAGGARRARPQPRARQRATAACASCSTSPRSPAARQGELQHVAFACGDALATARAMRERGVPLRARARQLLRRPGRPPGARARAAGGAARARRALRPQRPTASSCTSTRPTSAGACSSRCSSGAAATAATAPRIHPSGWRDAIHLAEERDATAGRARDHRAGASAADRPRSASCPRRRRYGG